MSRVMQSSESICSAADLWFSYSITCGLTEFIKPVIIQYSTFIWREQELLKQNFFEFLILFCYHQKILAFYCEINSLFCCTYIFSARNLPFLCQMKTCTKADIGFFCFCSSISNCDWTFLKFRWIYQII